MAAKPSTKQLTINKDNKMVIIATSAAVFVVIFCAIAAHALFSQMLYQNRIIGAKKTAVKQLKKNEAAITNLTSSYQNFVGSQPNVLGGNPSGVADKDGDNSKIVLDALPSKYDFPALAASLEKLLSAQNITIDSITGTDDEVAQTGNTISDNPQVVAIPFEVAAKGDYQSIQKMTQTFERSIRPIQIQTLHVSGSQGGLTLNVTAKTYYQPEKQFNIGKKDIR